MAELELDPYAARPHRHREPFRHAWGQVLESQSRPGVGGPFRVAAYASLMTDAYPPFRLDMGGDEPTTAPDTVPPTPASVSA